MKRFLVDNQLPTALAGWIESQGFPAQHVATRQLAQSSDELIWQQADREGAVIVSKDDDFAHLTLVRPEPVAVVWIRIGNCRTPVLLAAIERAWPQIVQQLEAGARLIEVY